jgi:hypothetical protein
MGLRRILSRYFVGAFDFGGELPSVVAGHRSQSTQDTTNLRRALEEAQEACRHKDELIARLQAGESAKTEAVQIEMANTEMVMAEMVTDGPAYYVRRHDSLDGPFCTSCFQRNHEMNRVECAAKSPQARGVSSDWVKCVKCQVPFHSDRVSRYLNLHATAAAKPAAKTAALPSATPQAKPAQTSSQPRDRTRRPKKAASTSEAAVQLAAPPARKSTTPRKKAAKGTTPPSIAPESPSDVSSN